MVWAQQHLVAAGADIPVTGFFGPRTARAVREFKEARGLPANGVIDTETWERLLELTPYRPSWAGTRSRTGVRVKPATKPLSANLPAKAYEIPPGPRR